MSKAETTAKRCLECGEPIVEQHGNAIYCTEECRSKARKAYRAHWYKANRKRVSAQQRAYRKANCKKVRAYARAYYLTRR